MVQNERFELVSNKIPEYDAVKRVHIKQVHKLLSGRDGHLLDAVNCDYKTAGFVYALSVKPFMEGFLLTRAGCGSKLINASTCFRGAPCLIHRYYLPLHKFETQETYDGWLEAVHGTQNSPQT